MATYFEIKKLQPGYRWNEMFFQQQGMLYAVNVLNIPLTSIKKVKCDLDTHTLGIWLEENAHLDQSDWFLQMVRTHSHVHTEPDLITFF